MNSHLYVVKHQIEGKVKFAACVGDDELAAHICMTEHLGGHLVDVLDAEYELKRFVWDCCFEGHVKSWLDA